MIEHKSFDVEFKSFGDSGEVELYAAAFNNVDRVDEVILPGAFKNLDSFVKDGWLGVNHDLKGMGHATIERAVQDDRGLLLTANFHSTAAAQELRTIVKERKERGKSVKASIGYSVKEDSHERREGKKVRLLKSIHIFEASIVNLPANPMAEVGSVKSINDGLISMDELRAMVEVETKAGRVLSRENHGRLKEYAASLTATLAKINDMIAAHDPDKAPDEPGLIAEPPKSITPPEPSADVMDIFLRHLAGCAR